jgi:hypothetical protein
VTSFDGKKFFVLATSSSLGTGAIFGWILIIGSILCAFMIILIYFLNKKNAHIEYDINKLKWT